MMKYRKVILTDVDNVLLDWTGGFKKWAVEVKGLTYIPGNDHEYNLWLWFEEMDNLKEAMVYIEEFNNSEYFSELEPHEDARTMVQHLTNIGYVFIPITLMGNGKDTRDHRITNLSNVFGAECFDFDRMHAFAMNAEKTEAFIEYQDSGLFYIEDHTRHAHNAHEHGLRVLLMDVPTNQHDTTNRFPRVKNWSEAARFITA